MLTIHWWVLTVLLCMLGGFSIQHFAPKKDFLLLFCQKVISVGKTVDSCVGAIHLTMNKERPYALVREMGAMPNGLDWHRWVHWQDLSAAFFWITYRVDNVHNVIWNKADEQTINVGEKVLIDEKKERWKWVASRLVLEILRTHIGWLSYYICQLCMVNV